MRVNGPSREHLDTQGEAFEELVMRGVEQALRVTTKDLKATWTGDDLAVIGRVFNRYTDTDLLPWLAESYLEAQTSQKERLLDQAVTAATMAIPPPATSLAEQYLATASNRLKDVSNVVWDDARKELLTGMQQGESVPQLRKRVMAVTGVSRPRATMIARTEVIGAQNRGSISQMTAAALPGEKSWLATPDHKTRESHRRANGQTRKLLPAQGDTLFAVGGVTMDGPHDPSAPPGETINCRCTLIYELADEGVVEAVGDGVEEEELDEAETLRQMLPPGVHPFHLPGKHNQKDHGHGGKKGPAAGGTGTGAMHKVTVSGDDAAAFKGTSAEAYLTTNAKGETVFTPERQKLHQQILDDTLAGHQPQDNPRYHIMGGGPASGKSSMEKKLPEISKGHALLNADEVKARLPEYKAKGAAGAGFTHEESSWVAKRIQDEAFNRKLNVTLDGTGDNGAAGVRKKLTAARNAGYTVHAYYVTAPTDAAVARAASRGARTGRIVPEPVIRATHRNVSDTFPKVLDDFDSAVLMDNTGASPITVLERKGGKTTVHDPDLYDAFLAKASE